MRRRSILDHKEDEPFSQINVTPLVDVILVILVIFMVLGPLISKQGLTVDIPRASKTEDIQKYQDISISIDSGGRLFLDETLVTPEQISQKVIKLKKEKKDVSVIVSADKNVLYNQVVDIMDKLKSLGVNQFALELKDKP